MNNRSLRLKEIIRWSRRIIFFYGFLFFVLPVTSQSFYFDNYGVQEGLSSSKIYSIIQDQRDYIWLGTESGVSRFNGFEFENFSSGNGMADNGVYSIFEDSNGDIWFGHLDGGVTLFDGYDFKVMHFDTIEIKGDVTSITEPEEGRIWVTTSSSGALRITWNNESRQPIKVDHFSGREGLSDIVFGTCTSKDSGLFCLTDIGIKQFDQAENKFKSLLLEGLTQYWIKTIMFEDSHGNWWFGTYNGGLYKYDRQDDSIQIYDKRDGLAKNWVTYVTEDSYGNIWVGTFGGGITVIHDGNLKTYNTENGLPDDYVKYIIEDKEGNILIGSQDKGLSIFKGEQFITYTISDGLGDESVWAIHQDRKGNFWFGTNQGISLLNPDQPREKRFTYFNHENESIGDKIRFIREDMNGTIWIGTDGDGIFQYTPASGQFIYDSYLNRNLYRPGEQHVKALEVDRENHLWIGTFDGLGFWDIDRKDGRMYTQIDGLAGNNIKSLYCDSKGSLWIGSDQKKGLTKYDPEHDRFEIINPGIEIIPASIVEDRDGKIWIGTSSGLYVYDNDSISLYFTQSEGLLSNNITAVDVDQDNNIYIGTNKGLNKYIQAEEKIYTFTRRNGYVGIETKDHASYRDKDGNMWFGTADGATCYFPHERLQRDELEPLTHIKGMQVNYESREMIPNMKLNHTEKSIVFDYYSICMTNPDAVKYQVRLVGAEDEWRPVTSQTRAIYSALSPNRYTFQIKAKNNAGIWNREPISFHFTITPPFYATWWFILSCVVIAFLGVFAYIKIREKNLIRENKILEEKVAVRTAEVVQKSKELEEKNKDIMDSIKYAKRIQNAILPPENSFAETFILFKPKDIVSGDFYWLAMTETKQVIAAVDCTGHGVPGAFMSIIGYNSLNKIVKEYGFLHPADILDQLNDEVANTLQQQTEEDEVKDGMDIALMIYDSNTKELEFAGAYNPLYMIRDGALKEIKGDRFSIGRTSTKVGQKFTNHKIQLKPGDTTYIFSDGYADQFGGDKGKKLKAKAVKKMLMEIQGFSMQEQKEHLDKVIEEWKGQHPQIDDILFIGSRVQ